MNTRKCGIDMKKLLIVVDMQNDFITGSLGTQEAIDIVELVLNKITKYEANGDKIIFTMDTHYDNYLDTKEGKILPIRHCIKDSDGWIISNNITDVCDICNYKVYEKVTFGSSELAKDIMNGMYDDISEIELIGLCTDICVISNALLIKSFLPEIQITVDSNCCAGVTRGSHNIALEAMKMCQINIV